MKKIIFTSLLGVGLSAYGQVGVNTINPAATLDITAKTSTGTSSNIDGVLIPRLDRQRAQSMTGIPTSTLLFVNSIATGSQTGTAINIDAVGYYYYDGTAWVKLHNPANALTGNIYNTDGTLTGNRTVTQGANRLAFTGTQTNAFSVNGKNFSVDAANGRVGIGTTAPSSFLSVQNTPGATTNTISAGIENCGTACLQGISRNITLYNLNATSGQFAELGFIPSTSETGLSGASITGIDRDIANSYAGLQFFTRNAVDFAPRLTIKSSGNIGIGTTAPTNKLHIESSTSGVLKIVDGTQGTDKVLTSDANGVATWKVLPAAPASTNIYNTDGSLTGNRTVTQGANRLAFTGTAVNAFSVAGSSLSVDATNNRVGIGTTSPQRVLEVSANNNPIRVTNLPNLTSAGGNTDILTISSSGDIQKAPLNNLLAGPVSLTSTSASFTASGNEAVIWCTNPNISVTLPTPSNSQIGKSLSIVAAGGAVSLLGSTPTTYNGVKLGTVNDQKRITIFAIAAGVFANATNEWVVIAKDF